MRIWKGALCGILAGSLILTSSRAMADFICNCQLAIIPTVQMITAAIAAQTEALNISLEKLASDVNGNSGAEKAAVQELRRELEAFLQNQMNAEAAMASQRRLLSQGFNPCPGRDVASAGASGSKASGQARKALNDATAEIGEGKAKNEEEARDKRRKIVSEGPLKDTDPMGHFLMPEDGLIKGDDVQVAQDMITLASDPYPNPKIADEESRAGADAKLEQRIKQSRLAPVIDALNAVKTFHDGTTQADLVLKYAQEAGIDASSVPVENGMTSMAAFYKVLAKDGRLLNSNWHQYVIDGQLDEAGLLKEMLLMKATSLAMKYDMSAMFNRLNLLMAISVAIAADDANARVSGRMYAPGVAPVGTEGE